MSGVERSGSAPTGPIRTSARLHRKPSYFTPYGTDDPNDEDIMFQAVVTEAKGFQAYTESISFKGQSSWRLSQIVRKVIRGLRIDPKYKYDVLIWNSGKESKVHLEWERLGNISQLQGRDVSKLRIYRRRRHCSNKKQEQKKETSEPVTEAISPYARTPAVCPATQGFNQNFMVDPQMAALMFSQVMMMQYQQWLVSCMWPMQQMPK